jgi:cytochrome bd-type quinol oxidase subunit 2
MVLLWCLIGRGLWIEMRSHLSEPVWQTACDVLFPVASFLIALAIDNASAGTYGLTVGLIWFVIGLGLVGFYIVFIYRLFGRNAEQPGDQY